MAPSREEVQELIELVVRHLVDYPDEVQVSMFSQARAVTYELEVNDVDLGRVIGREGRTARAIREVVNAATLGWNERVYVEILD